jgi:hypothetical protein
VFCTDYIQDIYLDCLLPVIQEKSQRMSHKCGADFY